MTQDTLRKEIVCYGPYVEAFQLKKHFLKESKQSYLGSEAIVTS